MSKITNLVLFISIALLLCHFGGLITDTPAGSFIELLLNIQNMQSYTLFQIITGAVTGISLAGTIAIGFFAPQSLSILIKAPIVSGFIFIVGYDLLKIFQILSEVNIALATIIVAPMMIVFFIATMEWWQ